MADPDLSSVFANLFAQGTGSADASDITAFKSDVLKNDWLNSLAAGITGAKFNTATWSPATSFGVSALQSFLGAAMGEYARQQEGAQLESVAKVLPQLYKDPLSVEVPAGVDPTAFASLKLSAVGKQAANKAAAVGKAASTMAEIFKSKLTAAADAEGKVIGTNNAYGTTGTNNPDSPASKDEDEARKEITAMPAPAQLLNAMKAEAAMRPLVNDPSRASDVAFVKYLTEGFNARVIRDSNGTAQIEGADSELGQWKGMLERFLNGGSTLGIEGKKQFYDQFLASQAGVLSAALVQAGPRLTLTEKRGGSRTNALPFDAQKAAQIFGLGGGAQGSASEVPTVSGGVAPPGQISGVDSAAWAARALELRRQGVDPLTAYKTMMLEMQKPVLSTSGVPIG